MKKVLRVFFLVFALLFLNLLSINVSSVKAEEPTLDLSNAYRGEIRNYWALVNYGSNYVGGNTVTIFLDPEAIANEEIIYILISEYDEYGTIHSTYYERGIDSNFASRFTYKFVSESYGKKQFNIFLLSDLYKLPFSIIDRIDVDNLEKLRTIEELNRADFDIYALDYDIYARGEDVVWTSTPYRVYVDINNRSCDYKLKNVTYSYLHKNEDGTTREIIGNAIKDESNGDCNRFYFNVSENSIYTITVEDYFGIIKPNEGEYWRIEIVNFLDTQIQLIVEYDNRLTSTGVDLFVSVFDGSGTPYPGNMITDLYVIDTKGNQHDIRTTYVYTATSNGVYTVHVKTSALESMVEVNIINIDENAPIILMSEQIHINSSDVEKTPYVFNPHNYILATDDMSKGEDLEIIVNYYEVSLAGSCMTNNRLSHDVFRYLYGVHDVCMEAEVYDEAGHRALGYSIIKVTDNTKPTISADVSEIILEIGDDMPTNEELKQRFDISTSDNSILFGDLGRDIEVVGDLSNVNLEELGKYEVYIYSVDKAGNTSETLSLIVTVTVRKLIIDAVPKQYIVYGEEMIEILYTCNGNLCINPDNPSDSEILVADWDKLSGELYIPTGSIYAGEYNIYSTLTINSKKYELVLNNLGVFTIKQRTFKIVANSYSIDYKDADPNLTWYMDTSVCNPDLSTRYTTFDEMNYSCTFVSGDRYNDLVSVYDVVAGRELYTGGIRREEGISVKYNLGDVTYYKIHVGDLSVKEASSGGRINYAIDFYGMDGILTNREPDEWDVEYRSYFYLDRDGEYALLDSYQEWKENTYYYIDPNTNVRVDNLINGYAKFYIYPKYVEVTLSNVAKIYGEDDPNPHYLDENKGLIKEDGTGNVQYEFTCFSYKEPIKSMCLEGSEEYSLTNLVAEIGMTITREEGENVGNYKISGHYNNDNYEVFFNEESSPEYNRLPAPAAYLTIVQRKIEMSVEGVNGTGKYNIFYEDALPTVTVRIDTDSDLTHEGLASNTYLNINNGNIITFADRIDYGEHRVKYTRNGNVVKVEIGGYEEYITGVGKYVIERDTITILNIPGEDVWGNYNVTFNNGELEVFARLIYIEVVEGLTKVYGENDPTFTNTYIDNKYGENHNYVLEGNTNFVLRIINTLNNETIVNNKYEPFDKDKLQYFLKRSKDSAGIDPLDPHEGEMVGLYLLSEGQHVNDTNYIIEIYQDYYFEITERDIIVVINNAEIEYNYDNFVPKFSYSFSNLKFTDVLIGQPTVAGINNGYRNNGYYDITIGHITPISKAPSVTSEGGYWYINGHDTYISQDRILTLDNSLIHIRNNKYSIWDANTNTFIDTNIDFEEYSVSDNYNVSYQAGRLEVIPRKVVIIPDSGKSKTYGEFDPEFTYKVIHYDNYMNNRNILEIIKDPTDFVGRLDRTPGEKPNESYFITQNTLAPAEKGVGAGFNFEIMRFDASVAFEINKREYIIRHAAADENNEIHVHYGNGGLESAVKGYVVVSGSLADNPMLCTEEELNGETVCHAIFDVVRGSITTIPENAEDVNEVGYPVVSKDLAIQRFYDGIDVSEYYNFTFVPATLIILPRVIEITPDLNQSKVYGEGGDDCDISFTYKPNLVKPDDEFRGCLGRNPIIGSNGELTTEEAGNYIITLGDLEIGPRGGPKSKNYKLTMNGSVTYIIKPKTLYVVAQVTGDNVMKTGNHNTYTMIFGNSFEIGYTAEGLVKNTSLGIDDSLEGDVLLLSVDDDGQVRYGYYGVENYTIIQGELKVANNKGRNYNFVFESAEFIVTKKVIYIHPDALTKIYKQEEPELTYTVTGLDTPVIPTGSLSRRGVTYTSDPTKDDPAGKYEITLGTLNYGPDYNLEIDTVYFEILPIQVYIEANPASKMFGYADPELTFNTYVEGGYEIDVPWQQWIEREPGEAVGEYQIIKGGLKLSDNYTIHFTGNTFLIYYDVFRYIIINNITQNQYQTQLEETEVRLEARFNKGADETDLGNVSWSIVKDGKEYPFTKEFNNIVFTPSGSAGVYTVTASYSGISATYQVHVSPNNVSLIQISLDKNSKDVQKLGDESELIYKADIVLYNNDFTNIVIEWFIADTRVCQAAVTSLVSYCIFTPNEDVSVPLGESIVYASIGSKTFSNGLKFTLQDNAAPTITLKGDSISYIEAYQNGTQVPFVDELYEAWDDIDGDITHKVKVTGIEDINYYKKGRYMVIYTVEDSHGHIASNYRTVVVRDTRAPIASLNHPELSEITLEYGEPYEELGATGYDLYDQYYGVDVIPSITQNINFSKIGRHEVRYLFLDSSGNFVELVRIVHIIDIVPPTITLEGPDTITLEYLDTFKDPGAWFDDNYDGRFKIYASKIEFIDPDTHEKVEVSSVDTSILGEYLLTYYRTDSNNNAPIPVGGVSRMVAVKDNTPPVITLLGANPYILRYGDQYEEPGFTVIDNYDGDITNDSTLVEVEAIIGDTLGEYYVKYKAIDTHGNRSETVTRVVIIMDLVSPSISFTDRCPPFMYIEALQEEFDPLCSLPGTGFVVYDDYLPDIEVIQNWVTYRGGVDTTTVGTYEITYSVSDRSGNKAIEKVRTIVVRDTTKPTITLKPKPGEGIDYYLEVFSSYEEYGWEVSDIYDDYHENEITVEVETDLDVDRLNTYVITYTAIDSNGNRSDPAYRHVTVRDSVPPVVTLIGDPVVVLERGETKYKDRGAQAYDNYDKQITDVYPTNEEMPDGFHKGTFYVEFCASDSSGNIGCATRTVIVQDTIAPEIRGVENGAYYNRPFYIYFDPTYVGTDEILTAKLNDQTITSPWQIYKEGPYHLVVMDDAGNTTTVDFVLDMTAPVILGTNDKIYINHDVNIHSDEALQTITYRFGNGGYISENANNIVFKNEGEYWVYATDMAGNTGKVVQFIIDKTAPEFALVGVENGGITSSNVTLITEPEVVVSVNGEYISTTSTFAKDGYYKVTIRDKAGNDVFIQFVINNRNPVTISDKSVSFLSQNNVIGEFIVPPDASYPRGVGFIYAKPLLDGTFEYISGTLFSDEEYSKLTNGESITYDKPLLGNEEMAVAFIVTLDQLNKFTTQTVEGDQDSTITYALIAIIIAAIGGGTFYFFVVVKRKKEDEEYEEEEVVEDDEYY